MYREPAATGDEETTFARRHSANSSTPSLPFTTTAHNRPFTLPAHDTTFRPRHWLHRIRRLIGQRPGAAWWTVVVLLLLILLVRMPSSSPRPQKPRQEVLFTHDRVEYQDTTEITDYALLDKLLKGDHAAAGAMNPHPIQFNRQERTPQWVSNRGRESFARLLQQQHVQGHGASELEQLAAAAGLPYVDNQAHTVAVTAIVYYGGSGSQPLDAQLQAIFAQTVIPENVWIVCTPAARAEVRSKAIAFQNNKRLRVMAWDPVEWLQVAARAPSDFIWIIDPHVAPGKRYLEHMLRLANTDTYEGALLGTNAMAFRQQRDTSSSSSSTVECEMVDGTQRGNTSQAVDMISDLWLVRRVWLAHVKTEAALHYDPELFGYALSRSLRTHAGIPSILIPSDPRGDGLRLQRLAGGSDADAAHTALCRKVQQHVAQSHTGGTAWQEDMVAPGAHGTSVVFIVDGPQQLRQMQPLLCRFVHSSQRAADIHVATVHGLRAPELRNKLREYDEECMAGITVHDLDMRSGRDEDATPASQTAHEVVRLISVLQPRLLIHLAGTGAVAQAIEVARDISKTTTIGLPARDVRHALWAADMPLEALEQWNRFSIKLVFVTDRRPHALARLLRSAARAHYFGDTVDVAVVMEQTSDRVTQAFVGGVPWPHGAKDVRHRITRVGEMPVHVEAWYPSGDHEYGVLLDDAAEVSPQFYAWAKHAILRYRYSPGTPKDAGQLLGVSLYAPRLAENDATRGRQLFDPAQVLAGAGLDPRTVYAMQAVPPAHAGAVFFPEHWREFHDYISARVADMKRKQLQTIEVPNARSSRWSDSWRRYMDELLYMRGYVMLYPNLAHGASLSTLHLDLGSHPAASYAHAAALFRVPLLGDSDADTHTLPAWGQLPLLDMWGEPRSLASLVDAGMQLQRQVSACPPLPLSQHMHDPSDMLCPRARLVEIPVPVEQQLQSQAPPQDWPARTVLVPAHAAEPTA